jgi:protein-S-isoprenylcysteine O-methyltransferase Ste14
MAFPYRYLFPAMWLTWALYWWVLSLDVKTPSRIEPFESRLLHVVPLMLAFYLLSVPKLGYSVLNERFLPWSAWAFWVGAVLTAGGLFFAIWARHHLGKNWSGIVTVKEDHELIMTGPYGIVRLPIYTGLLLAFVGTAIALGEWRGVLAFAIVLWSLLRKLRFEERWMREQFGETYEAYSRRVPAIVPFVL